MSEDSWLRVERQYFAKQNQAKFDLKESKLNKILETYNRFLQKILLGESPFVAEDLKITLEKSKKGEEIGK